MHPLLRRGRQSNNGPKLYHVVKLQNRVNGMIWIIGTTQMPGETIYEEAAKGRSHRYGEKYSVTPLRDDLLDHGEYIFDVLESTSTFDHVAGKRLRDQMVKTQTALNPSACYNLR